MRIQLYAPANESHHMMYDDKDSTLKKIVGDDILNIVRKDIDNSDDFLITYIKITIDEYTQDIDPVFPLIDCRYNISVSFMDTTMKTFKRRYSIQTNQIGFPRKGTGIKSEDTGETIVEYNDAINLARNLHQIYNFKYIDYMREKFLSKAPKGRERAVEHTIRMESGENQFSDIDESTCEMLKKEIEDNMEDIEGVPMPIIIDIRIR